MTVAEDQRDRIAALKAENVGLRKKLKQFGQHEGACRSRYFPHTEPCSCGLEES